jgi:hypothetical protein
LTLIRICLLKKDKKVNLTYIYEVDISKLSYK